MGTQFIVASHTNKVTSEGEVIIVEQNLFLKRFVSAQKTCGGGYDKFICIRDNKLYKIQSVFRCYNTAKDFQMQMQLLLSKSYRVRGGHFTEGTYEEVSDKIARYFPQRTEFNLDFAQRLVKKFLAGQGIVPKCRAEG